ncbi:MAG: peptidase S41 [Gemmatimonadales bacterium]|nr:MAG: peptidase S41 [Gemmatimonadales bacterium]
MRSLAPRSAARSEGLSTAVSAALLLGLLLVLPASVSGVVQSAPETPAAGTATEGTTGYYQSPALHGTTLVFSSEGDLWVGSTDGGTARRLTAHPAPESDPHISPDGRLLAFTASYEGTAAVHVMPLAGGDARRLTFGSGAAQVQGWTPEGEVLYSTTGVVGPTWTRHLGAVDPETLERRDFPLADARQGAFDDEGTLHFTRFGLDVTGDNAREYRGGAMAQLWSFHPDDAGAEGAEARRVAPDHPGNLTRPMWWDGALYLVSDADGLANLWRLDPESGEGEALTEHRDFEVRGASHYQGRIVYQHGADLRLLDLATGVDEEIEIRLATDRARTRTRWLESATDWLGSVSPPADGQRVAVTARGRLAVATTGPIRRVEFELPDAARARSAVMSPDGEHVYAFVDSGHEKEIWRFPSHGLGPGEPLTDDGDTQRLAMFMSPDGRVLAHTDRERRLWLLDLEAGTNTLIDTAPSLGHRGVVWAPDSRALAFVRPATSMLRPQLHVHDRSTGETHVLTSDRYESSAPAFTPDGTWLYFLSDRNFVASPGSPWGDRNLGPGFDQRTRIYALALQAGNAFPMAPPTELDFEAPADEGNGAAFRDGAAPRGEGDDDLPAIDFEGLRDRLHEAPVPSGNYSGLMAARDRLFLLERTGAGGPQPLLRTIDLTRDSPRLDTVSEGVNGIELSADLRRMLVRRGNDHFLVPTAAQLPGDLSDHRIRLADWRLAIDPVEEWRQMYLDGWRMQRDFLFDPEMRGQDWDAIRDKYLPLAERIGDRRELDDVFGQMVAELGVLHSQVRGGDYRTDPESGQPAFLGGSFEASSGGLRISHIYRTDPELPSQRAPLARPGVELETGDLITAVNGRSVRSEVDLARALEHQAGEQVRLDVRRGERDFSVVTQPVGGGQDATLRYSEWVHERRTRVEEASDGRMGYLHIRAMGGGNMAEFVREFYANIDREGLVIDVRRNTGGNIDSWIIERLLRRAWSFWEPPGQDPYWNMQQAFRGHITVLVDPLTYSDGETFAAGVKALELGPVVGERTAGAGVWLSDVNRLADQGIMRAAQTPQFGTDGRWLIEGFGVEPDLHVENLPHATWRGEDAQLDRAIEALLEIMEAHPVTQPPAEPIPGRGQTGRDVPP